MMLGIILMVAGFIGVLVCAKLQKSNPAIQPVAILCALVMVGGLVVYGYSVFKGDDPAAASEIYAKANGDGIGKYLKRTAGGKKVYLVVNPGAEKSPYVLNEKEALQKAGGTSVEVITIDVPDSVRESGDLTGFLKADHIDKLVAGDPAAVYVLDIGMPEKGTPKCFSLPEDKRPTIFLTNSGMSDGKRLKKWIKDGKILGMLIGNPAKRDPKFEPSLKKLDETFNRQYVIVDKNNLDKFEKNF